MSTRARSAMEVSVHSRLDLGSTLRTRRATATLEVCLTPFLSFSELNTTPTKISTFLIHVFFRKNNFIRTTRLKFAQKLRTS